MLVCVTHSKFCSKINLRSKKFLQVSLSLYYVWLDRTKMRVKIEMKWNSYFIIIFDTIKN